jgi:hypothetical protein
MKETRDIIVTVLGFSFSLTDTELILQITVLILTIVYLTGKIFKNERDR